MSYTKQYTAALIQKYKTTMLLIKCILFCTVTMLQAGVEIEMTVSWQQ